MNTDQILKRLEEHTADLKTIHESRHDYNSKIATLIDSMRIMQIETDKRIGAITFSLEKMLAVLEGSMGRDGVVSDVNSLKKCMGDLEKKIYAANAIVAVVIIVIEIYLRR